MKMFFVLILDHLSANVLTFDQNIDRLGENVGGSSLSLPYFVMLISFTQCAKKLLTVIKSSSISALLLDFFWILIGKQM